GRGVGGRGHDLRRRAPAPLARRGLTGADGRARRPGRHTGAIATVTARPSIHRDTAMKTIAPLVLAASLPPLAGCRRDDPAPASADAVRPTTALGRTVPRGTEDARRALRAADLSLTHHYDVRI